MRTSDLGVEFIKVEEGLRLFIYRDQVGRETIGYGHLLSYGERARKAYDSGITEEAAEAILRRDLGYAEHGVLKAITVPLAQHQFDALVSFTFNLGVGALASSTLTRRINAGDPDAHEEFPRWVYGTVGGRKAKLPVLVQRRERERRLFLHGVY